MAKSFVVAGSALVLAPIFLFGSLLSSSAEGSPPLLSGTYLVSLDTYCQPTLTVEVAKGTIKKTVLGPGSGGPLSGTIIFNQGSTEGSGTAKTSFTSVSGSPFLQGGNESGVKDAPLQQGRTAKKYMFAQTATTLSLTSGGRTDEFHIYYGEPGKTGIASAAVFAGMDFQGCANAGTATRK